MVVGRKCIFGSPVWAGKRGRKCFPWSGFPEMTENEAGFVQEENNFFFWFLMFGNRTDKLRCNLFVALSAVGFSWSPAVCRSTAQTLYRSQLLLLKFASCVFGCPVLHNPDERGRSANWEKLKDCLLRHPSPELKHEACSLQDLESQVLICPGRGLTH